jgi:hypothetical protein
MKETKKQLQKCLMIAELIERMEQRKVNVYKAYQSSVFYDLDSKEAQADLDCKTRAIARLKNSLNENLSKLC